MGFRHAAVLSSVSFCLGVLFINFNVDRRLLYDELTEKNIEDAFQYYTIFFNAPMAVKALLHAVMGMGLLGLVAKLHAWDESAVYFDGSSIVAFMFGVVLYVSVIISGLKTVVTPLETDTYETRVQAIRVVAAANTMIIFSLVAVLFLQAGQEYAKRLGDEEFRQVAVTENKGAAATETKKTK